MTRGVALRLRIYPDFLAVLQLVLRVIVGTTLVNTPIAATIISSYRRIGEAGARSQPINVDSIPWIFLVAHDRVLT